MTSRTLVSSIFMLPTASDLRARVREETARGVRFFRTSLRVVLVAVSYYLGTLLGLSLKPAQTSLATFWPPSAILLATFLLSPPRMWWAFLLAVLPAHLLAQLQAGATLPNALGWFIGTMTGALIGAVCIRYFKKEPFFDSVQGLIFFLGCGVLVPPLLKSFLDAAVGLPMRSGNDYWMSWTTRLSSNMISELTLVPTILLFRLKGVSWIRKATLSRWVEAGLLGFWIVFVSVLLFSTRKAAANSIPALIYAPLPFLLWASVRFGMGGLSASTLVVALISSWSMSHGRGPLTGLPMGEKVLSLQVLLGSWAVPLMLLAAAITERRRPATLILAQEQERHRIARELHDDIVQQLTLLGLELDSLRTHSDSSLKLDLDRLYEQVSNVSEATRNLSHELHPFALEYLGLARAMRTLCRDTGAHSSIDISFAEENVSPRLPADISLCLYRVAQEALQNIVKHSHARTGAMELKVRSGRVLLRIVDDGVGIIAEQRRGGGMGLASMRERVLALDGTFEITSIPGKGTTIQASVPLKESE